MSSWYEEFTEEERRFIADEAKKKLAAKKEGKICLVCSEFLRYADNNCLSHNKKCFICFPCRTSEINKVIYGIQEIKENS